MSTLTDILSRASDRYGNPYLIDFMERYHLGGLKDATEEQYREYIREEGLADESIINYSTVGDIGRLWSEAV